MNAHGHRITLNFVLPEGYKERFVFVGSKGILKLTPLAGKNELLVEEIGAVRFSEAENWMGLVIEGLRWDFENGYGDLYAPD